MVAIMDEPVVETQRTGPNTVVITRVSLSFGNLVSLAFRGFMALFVVWVLPSLLFWVLIFALGWV